MLLSVTKSSPSAATANVGSLRANIATTATSLHVLQELRPQPLFPNQPKEAEMNLSVPQIEHQFCRAVIEVVLSLYQLY
jgi:hypothetical protein